MLTYSLSKTSNIALYEQLYRCIKDDILSGRLACGEKLPSKRALSDHLETSIITVKAAYEQLIAEGYVYSVEKKGYYVNFVELPPHAKPAKLPFSDVEPQVQFRLDMVTNHISKEYFPFTVWARTMRQVLLDRENELLLPTPYNGSKVLRDAIAEYLWQFRGMHVDAEQIIIGAGTEFLYLLLIQLLGRDRCYAVEDPGYSRIARTYESNGVATEHIPIDEYGLSVSKLRETGSEVVHISPSHHYPTGIVMPIGRRQELLRWAGEREGRYILEDDYDSEFRFVGKPIPTLFSVDKSERVIYLNTFSKTISPSIRISYMILPPTLAEVYRRKLGFYSCSVSAFEQYTLAKFMTDGSYEKHIARMRNRYRRKRDAVISAVASSPLSGRAEIKEQDAGLHFIMKLNTDLTDSKLKGAALEAGINLAPLSDYYYDRSKAEPHCIVINYSGIELDDFEWGIKVLADII